VIPYENLWTIRTALELITVATTAWMVSLGLGTFSPSLLILFVGLALTRRVIVIDRQRNVFRVARIFSLGPGPAVALSAINPVAVRKPTRVGVFQTTGNIRRQVGTKVVEILELELGPGAPKLTPATESMSFELAGVISEAVGKAPTIEMQRAMGNRAPRSVVRAALSTAAALGLAGVIVNAASDERAGLALFLLAAPMWVVVATRWFNALAVLLPRAPAVRIAALPVAAIAAIASVTAAFATHAGAERARADSLATGLRARVESQSRRDAIPAQRDTAPSMASDAPPALAGAVSQDVARQALEGAGFDVRAAPYPGNARWKLFARGRAVSLTVELYEAEQSATSVRRILQGHWLRLDKREDATREAILRALSTSATLDRASIEQVLRAHGAPRLMSQGDDSYTHRAWRGGELIAVTAVPFETHEREQRLCVADATQVLCAVAYQPRGPNDPRWLPWALHAALGRATP
jgi:hypothetical protein